MNDKIIFRAPDMPDAFLVKIKFGNTITKIVTENDDHLTYGRYFSNYYKFISSIVFPNSIKEISIDKINTVNHWSALTSITVGDEATRDLVNSSTCLGQVIPVSQWIIDPSINAVLEDPNLKIPLTFTAESANSTIYIKATAPSFGDLNLEYKTCISNVESEWAPYVIGTSGPTISLASIGDLVSFRAGSEGNQTFSIGSSEYLKFVMTGAFAASGNIQSLLDLTMTRMDVPAYCYSRLFFECRSLTQAPALPATTLALWCYFGMFDDCRSLNQAPELPATTLAEYCYIAMFSFCSSLTQAPALPATTLADSCYFRMFDGCTSLTQAPALPATTLADSCYYSMFEECVSLTQAPALPATTLVYYCYANMFYSCISLTLAPALPATTLGDYCYEYMFENSSVSEVRMHIDMEDDYYPDDHGYLGYNYEGEDVNDMIVYDIS